MYVPEAKHMIGRMKVLLKLVLYFLKPFILLLLELSSFPLTAVTTIKNSLPPTLLSILPALKSVLMNTFLYFREQLKSIELCCDS